jgi:hypothetical protein
MLVLFAEPSVIVNALFLSPLLSTNEVDVQIRLETRVESLVAES